MHPSVSNMQTDMGTTTTCRQQQQQHMQLYSKYNSNRPYCSVTSYASMKRENVFKYLTLVRSFGKGSISYIEIPDKSWRDNS